MQTRFQAPIAILHLHDTPIDLSMSRMVVTRWPAFARKLKEYTALSMTCIK